MAYYVSLPTVIESDVKQIIEEYSVKRAYASLADGMHNVNRAILYAMMHDFKSNKDGLYATEVCSRVKNSYHLHSETSIHKTALGMTGARLPLLKATNRKQAYEMRDGIVSQKYSKYYKTKWGEYVHSSSIVAPMEHIHTLNSNMPAYYPTMFPYFLFTSYVNINMGITHYTLPMCPEEIFNIMLALLEDSNAKIEDLLPLFKGPDIKSTYTVIANPQSRHTLLKDGYGKFDILTNFVITRDQILLKDVPYMSTKSSIEKTLYNANLESALLGTPLRGNSSEYIMTIPYKLRDGFGIEDLRKELYDKARLKKTVAVELVGFYPKDINSPYAGKLDIVGIKDLLISSLNYGYTQRIADINHEIETVQKELAYDSLMERLTRPETLEWYKPLLDSKNRKEEVYKLGNERILPYTFGKYVQVAGGITREEINYIFHRDGSKPNNNLDTRNDVMYNLAQAEKKLTELHAELEHDNIIKYLKSVIKDWLKEEECVRRSNILFTNGEEAITSIADESEQILVKHIVTTKETLTAKVNFVFYKDGTVDYWNPKYGDDIPVEFMIKPIHTVLKCTTRDTLLVMNSKRRFKTKVKYLINNLKEYNDIHQDTETLFHGVIVYYWNAEEPAEDDMALMVTSCSRVKKIPVTHLLQKFESVKPLPLYNGEYLKNIIFAKESELDKYTVEVVTSRGVKRRKLNTVTAKNIKGYVTLVSYTFERDALDFRLIEDGDANDVPVLEGTLFKNVPVDSDKCLKRDIYKEIIVEEEGKYDHYINHKEYYTLEGKLTDVTEVFGTEDKHRLNNVLTTLPSGYIAVNTQQSISRVESSDSENGEQ